MIATLGMIIFFGCYAANHFSPHPVLALIAAIAAIVACIGLIIKQ